MKETARFIHGSSDCFPWGISQVSTRGSAGLQGAPLTQQRTREEKMGPDRKSRSSQMNRLAGVGIALVMMSIGAPAEAGGIGRFTGRGQSFPPAAGGLI